MGKEINKNLIAIYGLIVALFLFAISAYYVTNQKLNFRETTLIGDGVCGNLLSDSAQDICCLKAHENDAVTQCLGTWQYISGIKNCQYICKNKLPSCPDETKKCKNKKIVSRNSSKECKFDNC